MKTSIQQGGTYMQQSPILILNTSEGSSSLGIEYISRIGIDEIGYKIGVIASYIRERLLNMPSLSLLPSEGSILSFNVRDAPSSAVAKMLDSAGICTRSGLHCAPSAHAKCGTLSQGAVRLSFSCFNTLKEASAFCDVINGYIHQS